MASQTGTLKFRQSDGTYTDLYPKTTIAQVDGLQTQLDNINTSLQNKVDLSDLSGAISTVSTSNLTANRALISNSSGKIEVSSVTSTQLGYVSGVTSAIQTQLNNKAALKSPTFTGTPKAPTASAGTNTTQIATTAYVYRAINGAIAASY